MKRRNIFFRDNGLSPLYVLKSWGFAGKPVLAWPQFSKRKVVFTHLGRIGNVLACQLWNIKKGDEILVPSYNCGSEVDPFLWYGMNAVMYRIDSNLNIDIEDLYKRITEKTRIIYVIHYFGWPQPLDEILKLCRQKNIYLMEDSALSLFSNGPLGPIGLSGHAAIHSFRKTLPVPDGAALVLPPDSPVNSVPAKQPQLKFIAGETLPYLARWFMSRVNSTAGLAKSYFEPEKVDTGDNTGSFSDRIDMPGDYYFSEHIMPWTISRISTGILKSTDPIKIYESRRRNFKRLFDGIVDDKKIKGLPGPLPDGVCPLLMPLVVSDASKWIAGLSEKGIKATGWWKGFNQKLSWDNFPEAKNLKHTLLVLPVHQYLNDQDIDYIIKTVRDLSVTL